MAFTDAVHSFNDGDTEAMTNWCGEHIIDWVASSKPLGTVEEHSRFRAANDRIKQVSAGHRAHEWTTAAASAAIWAWFDELVGDHAS